MKGSTAQAEEQRLEALYACAILDTPAESAFDGLVTLAATACDAPIALFGLLDAHREWFKAACGVVLGELPRSQALSALAAGGSEPVVLPDARRHARLAHHPLVASAGVRFLAVVPLTAGEHLLGALCVADRTSRDLDARQRESLRALAGQALALLECRRHLVSLRQELVERELAQQTLAASESDFRLLADTLPHMVWVCHHSGRLDYLNPRGYEHFGLPRAVLRARFRRGELLHRDDRERVLSAWREAVATGQPMNVEGRLRGADGAYRWHMHRAQPALDERGRVVRWIGTSTDVHDVKEANERSAFLLALSTEMARISHPQELVCTAMQRLRARLRASSVALAEIDAAENEAVVLRQFEGEEARIAIASLSLPPFRNLAAESGQGLTTVMRDTRLDGRSAHLYEQWYAPNGVRAMVSAPLLRGGSLVALLSVVDEQPRDWTASEVELVKRVAEIVWPALEKARADRELAISEARLRLAQGMAQIGTWECDPAAQSAYFSAEGLELFGLAADETQPFGRWVRQIDPQDRTRVERALRDCVVAGTAELEYRYRHPARGLRWIYSKAGMVSYAGQRRLVGISLDVTERRQAEEALKEINRRKDEFLAMLAHELRNPLAPIRNAAQILRVHAAGKPELDWARSVIDRQTRHLVRLVDDLLDVSRIVRGQIVLQTALVELGDVVRHAVETSRPLIRERKHRFDVRLPGRPVRILGDLTRLAQVIANLLNNAAKYTEENGQIWLEADVEEDVVVIRVRDTGFGIAPTLLPHVFDLFTQAERTLDRSQGGLGIGLTLVHRLVEMHGGTVEAHSAGLGRGAEFIVRLPVAAGDFVVPPDEEPRPHAARPEQEVRILIVDDNVDAAESIAMLLDLQGYRTRSVHTARAALEAAATFRPDVVLLDIGLPEMDGYEVARQLRTGNAIERMSLVAVTGYGQPEDRARTRAAGFDEHLVKPVEPEALVELLRTLSPTRT